MKADSQLEPTDSSFRRFGGFRLDVRRRILYAPTGSPVPLTPRVLETLVYLVESPGVLLRRDALMDSIWPDSAVEPNNLSQNIAKLRRVFRETPGENRFIETVPGRGYRFVAEVHAHGARGAGLHADHGRVLRGAEADQLYRQALRLLQRPTRANCSTAVEWLEKVTSQEPDSALAHAWLADAHLLSVNAGHAGPEALQAAERNARRALDLRADTPVAHSVLATVQAQRGEWLAAESHFMTAIALDEADAMARVLHATFLLQQVGHTRRSLAQLRGAFRLLPDDPRMLMNLAMGSCIAGDDEEALRCAGLAISFGYPESAAPLPLLFMHVAARAGRYGEAADHARKLLDLDLWEREVVPLVHSALEHAAARDAATFALRELLDRALAEVIRTSGLVLLLALWLTQLDRVDLAFDAVHRALDSSTRPPNWQSLWLPELSPFRVHDRFDALAERLGMPHYWSVFGPPDSRH